MSDSKWLNLQDLEEELSQIKYGCDKVWIENFILQWEYTVCLVVFLGTIKMEIKILMLCPNIKLQPR